MMNKQTVIVIGAGAGVDIDMPVGSKLAGEIAEDTNFRTDAGKRLGGDERVWAASVQMAKLVGIDQSSTLVAGRSIARGITYAQSIDNYVHAHSDKEIIKIVAKNAIVHRILEAERNSALFIDPSARGLFKKEEKVSQSWLQPFFTTLQDGIVEADNLENIFDNLSIINFNYDRCIEHFLFKRCSVYIRAKELDTWPA
ncbi:MAG: hypothetical protein JO141_21210 [Bradyrhizobium sp.]|nr:hypothetical protein [Bradyrhizobium sp.]